MSTLLDRPLEEIELEEDYEDYLEVALAKTAFSRGTANVSPRDRKKLLPLLRHYAKMAKPFTACVRDNRKRFGPRAEAICAVVKDLIVGNTRWRGKGKVYRPRAVMASADYDALVEEFGLDYEGDEDTQEQARIFMEWLAEVTPGEIEVMLADLKAADTAEPEGSTTIGPPPAEADYQLAADASRSCGSCVHFTSHPKGGAGFCDAWDAVVETNHVSNKFEARAGEAPTSQEYSAEEGTADRLVELSLSGATPDDEGWAPILYEGSWALSPGKGQKPVEKKLTVVAEGRSDPDKLVVSLAELYNNFKDGAVEHVCIPTSHANKTVENTGFIRDLRLGKDAQGRTVLEGRHDFTEPDIKGKVDRGTIASRSAGILFNQVLRRTGKKFRAVLDHVALTNKPWIDGLRPFGISASAEIEALSFAEDTHEESGGGDKRMSETLMERLGLSEEEIEARLKTADEDKKELARLRTKDRETEVNLTCKAWEEEGKPPAFIEAAKAILLADDGATSLLLSEDGEDTEVTASDIVEKMAEFVQPVNLAKDDPAPTDEDTSRGGKPKDDTSDELELSHDERVEIMGLVVDHGMKESEAKDKVLAKRTAPEDDKKDD